MGADQAGRCKQTGASAQSCRSGPRTNNRRTRVQETNGFGQQTQGSLRFDVQNASAAEKSVPIFEALEAIAPICGSSVVAVAGETGDVRLLDILSEDIGDPDVIGAAVKLPRIAAPEHAVTMLHAFEYMNSFTDSIEQCLVVITSDHKIALFTVTGLSSETAPCVSLLRLASVGHHDDLIDLAFASPDEQLVAVACNGPEVRLHDLQTGDSDFISCAHKDTVLCVASTTAQISETQVLTLLATGSKDGTATLWAVNRNTRPRYYRVAELHGHTAAVGSLAFCGQSKLITTSMDKTVKMWDLKKVLRSIRKKLNVEAQADLEYTVVVHARDINCVACSHDGQVFATASQDKTVRLWNTSDGSEIATLRGHKRGVWKCAFAPVEKLIATASGDRTVKLWSLRDFSCVRTLEGHTNSVLSVAFVGNGAQLLTAGGDGVMRQWRDATTLELEEKKQEVAEKRLHEQQLSNHVLRREWADAVRVALRLDRPHKLFEIMTTIGSLKSKMLGDQSDSITGFAEVDEAIAQLDSEHTFRLLSWVRGWNTTFKTSAVAHTALHAVLRGQPTSALLKFPNITELVDGIIAYTVQHVSRVDLAITRTHISRLTLRSMHVLS